MAIFSDFPSIILLNNLYLMNYPQLFKVTSNDCVPILTAG